MFNFQNHKFRSLFKCYMAYFKGFKTNEVKKREDDVIDVVEPSTSGRNSEVSMKFVLLNMNKIYNFQILKCE